MLRKAVELGLGALVVTSENAQKFTDELVKKGKIKRHEGDSLIKEMMRKGEIQEKKLEKDIAKMVSKMLLKLDLASKSDVRRLEGEIKKIKAHKH